MVTGFIDVSAYLPDIMQGVVERVDAYFFGRLTDPFHVYYDKGLLGQVRRSVYKNNLFPLVWLVMKYDENFGRHLTTTENDFQIFITILTDNKYTQQQREDINFKPRLIPIYDRLMYEMKNEPWFVVGRSLEHKRTMLPYWGMSDVNGTDQDNLFKEKFIDAISINVYGLKTKLRRCVKVIAEQN